MKGLRTLLLSDLVFVGPCYCQDWNSPQNVILNTSSSMSESQLNFL